MKDIVVRVERNIGGACSGTLIAPTLVLTAAYCFRPNAADATTTSVSVQIGPDSTNWKDQVPSYSWALYDTDPDTSSDIAIVYLSRPVMEDAYSHRPLRWDNWDGPHDGPYYFDPGSTQGSFGVAGWSPLTGAWSCPFIDDDPGSLDPAHVQFRWAGEGLLPRFWLVGQTITTDTDFGARASKGDSGGPLFRQGPSGERYVVHVSEAAEPTPTKLSTRRNAHDREPRGSCIRPGHRCELPSHSGPSGAIPTASPATNASVPSQPRARSACVSPSSSGSSSVVTERTPRA